jgi:hypothetical protein
LAFCKLTSNFLELKYAYAAVSIQTSVARRDKFPGNKFVGAFFAAVCAEDVPRLTEAAIRRESKGTYLGETLVRRYQKYCGAWGPSGLSPKHFYAPVRSRVPALLISGVLDPATPPESAYQVAHYLVNGRVIAVKQGTHGTGSLCVDGLIGEFVKQGFAALLDASCAEQVHLPSFVTPAQPTARGKPL